VLVGGGEGGRTPPGGGKGGRTRKKEWSEGIGLVDVVRWVASECGFNKRCFKAACFRIRRVGKGEGWGGGWGKVRVRGGKGG